MPDTENPDAGHFAFGRNWQVFVQEYMTSERIDKAGQSLVDFAGRDAIAGKSFLDIGCGSGMFSLAAYRLGARQVLSFDLDTESVACCRLLWEREGKPKNWSIREGSVLDPDFLSSIEAAEFVYSWGVLHHTGRMWEAIANAAGRVASGGMFWLAIYNEADTWGPFPDGRIGHSRFWVRFKRFYSALPNSVQEGSALFLQGCMMLLYVLKLQNPFRKIREHSDNFRGMAWRVDIKDWLGGHPYEFARADALYLFMRDRGFELRNLKCNNGLLNNELLVQRVRSREE